MKIERKPLIWFLAIAFGVAWILFIVPLAFRQGNPTTTSLIYTAFWSLAMWAPGLGAILATRYATGGSLGTLNLGRLGEKRAYLWAWLLPPALAIATGLLTLALGVGNLDLQFTLIKQAMANAPGAETIPAWLIVVIQAAIAFTIGPLINTLFALGEELGWRGFLLPRLLPLGQWPAIVLSGVIWGIWHAPAILQGHNYPGHPVAGIFMMIVFCVLTGAIFSWLYLRTRSPWAPALAHGSLNAVAGLPLLVISGVDISIGGSLASLIGWIPLALFVVWLIWTRRLPVKMGEAQAEQPVVLEESPAD